ncbi:RGS domain-containing protein [Plasmodiophora brassicae]|uniref:RGS domain-containing protein n=1 Tax=Plasmodiophora brassicae TaxID=37360 RepID=A0A0G4IRJ1_PLABS|nr:hypothetical protein PBRA_005825 [Plasmodiophora brassicae]SPQ98256.1 unnamed protein product [Plasmodiophora brassicae]
MATGTLDLSDTSVLCRVLSSLFAAVYMPASLAWLWQRRTCDPIGQRNPLLVFMGGAATFSYIIIDFLANAVLIDYIPLFIRFSVLYSLMPLALQALIARGLHLFFIHSYQHELQAQSGTWFQDHRYLVSTRFALRVIGLVQAVDLIPVFIVMAMDASFLHVDPNTVIFSSHPTPVLIVLIGNILVTAIHILALARISFLLGPIRDVFGIRQEMSHVNRMGGIGVLAYVIIKFGLPRLSTLSLDMFVLHAALHALFVLTVCMPLYLSYTPAWKQDRALGQNTTAFERFLMNESVRDAVRPVMVQTFCLELLLFLQAEQQYRQMFTTVPRADQATIDAAGRRIIKDFIVENASLQVNISDVAAKPFRPVKRRRISLARPSTVMMTEIMTEFTVETFDRPRKEVVQLIQANIMTRIKSDPALNRVWEDFLERNRQTLVLRSEANPYPVTVTVLPP